ncbi:NBS-containing resistance-like protein, partial [Trifolium pratense]
MSSFTSCFYRRRKFQPISTTTNMKKYDVYLSFCDEDPDFFVLGIYKGLTSGSGINVFWDNKRIKRGDQEVPTSVLNVIGDCKLVGDKFMSWVAAISHNKAITYAGSTYLGHVFTNRIEREHIENVVELATRVITEKRDMFNVFYTESLNSRVQDVTQLLKQSKSPLILGIWGMPGIGKSTIAKAIYGQVGSYFRHKCLIENVKRSVQNKTYTLVSLQEKIILDMAREPENDISTIESGKVILKERLHSKRVLLVLDDVDNLEQLHALCGSREWFGEGSKIIITTTNRQLLKEHGADHIYRVKELDENESLELFNWKAFSQATSQEGFAELSRQVVAYSGGLPLALTDLGIHFNSETVDIWE